MSRPGHHRRWCFVGVAVERSDSSSANCVHTCNYFLVQQIKSLLGIRSGRQNRRQTRSRKVIEIEPHEPPDIMPTR
jgi:hypothetical protein